MQTRSLPADLLVPEIEKTVAAGGSFPLTVTGNSMSPTLHQHRDAVLLTAVKTIRAGDILLFRRNTGEYILHRVKKIRGGRLTMNGDAQTWTEEITKDRVIASVSHIRRAGKTVALNTPAARAYAFFWLRTRPLRPWLFRIAGFFR